MTQSTAVPGSREGKVVHHAKAGKPGVAEFSDAVMAIVTKRMPALLENVDVGSLPTPESAAERMLASLPSSPADNQWNELIGPFYDTSGLTRWLGRSRQNVHAHMRRHNILGVQTADGELLYPAWQFDDEGHLLPHLAEVLRTLRAAAPDPWANALWLTAPVERFDGHSAVQLLWNGQAESVLDAARHDAEALAR
jgi:hypothetical protein